MFRQLDLFATPTIGLDAAFTSLVRRESSHGAWVDHAPAWITGHDTLFDQLERSLTWRTESRRMYDRMVDTPRRALWRGVRTHDRGALSRRQR